MTEIDLHAVAAESEYPLDAFMFVQRGLDYTVRHTHGEPDVEPGETFPVEDDPEDSSRHVTGRQLCHGLRDYAVAQYGLMARSVLLRWGIVRCEDFGRIVFAMVEAGMMRRTDDDQFDDFVGVFDFREAFSPRLMLSDRA
jgi:uncharacterized repeat protein (TIGR04138 family)